MKHLKEKDLSLDKQVVSELSSNDTKVKTNEVVCATKVCTDSHFEICCAATKEDDCIASEACVSVNDCPVTVDSFCDECTVDDNCNAHIEETKLDC